MSSPTQRSLKYLREQGYLVGIVEQTIPRTFIKRDLFGFLDLLAVKQDQILGVQVTSGSNHSKRKAKILSHENWDLVRQSGMVVELHSWRMSTAKGRKKYHMRQEVLTPCKM